MISKEENSLKRNKENKSKPRKLIEFKLALERDIAVVDVAHVEQIDTIFPKKSIGNNGDKLFYYFSYFLDFQPSKTCKYQTVIISAFYCF